MSNHPQNKEQNRKVDLTDNQQNPGLAKPTDFEIHEVDDEPLQTPGHGQHGESRREYRKLLKERRGGEPKPIPDRHDPNDAELNTDTE